MNIRRTSTMLAVTVALLTGFAAFRHARPVHAQGQQPPAVTDRTSFGMVGITAGQTMRLNVVNTLPAGPSLPAGPVRVVLTFRGMNGQLLRSNRTGEVIRRVVDLERGHAAFLDLDFDEFPPGPSRVQARAVVNAQYQAGPSTAFPPSPIVPSVEVINNANGRTQFVVSNPGVIRGFNPQPDPPIE